MTFTGAFVYNQCPATKPNLPTWSISGSSVVPIAISDNITLHGLTFNISTYVNGTSTTIPANSTNLVSLGSNSSWTGFLYGAIVIQNVRSSASILYDSVTGIKCIALLGTFDFLFENTRY